MYCNRCGKKLKEDAKFCNNCGSPVENSHDSQYDYNTTYSSVTDEALIKEYVGNNYDKIKNTKFSLPTFFLGVYYFLYRKMWLYAILGVVISIVSLILSIATDAWYISLSTIVYIVFMSIKFNEIYLNMVAKRVEKIKMNNQNKKGQELLNICKAKGGVSVLAIVVIILFILPITFFITFFIIIYGIFEGVGDEIFSDYKDKVKNESELEYELPTIYKNDDSAFNGSNYQSYHYNDPNNSCDISITNYATYEDKTTEEHLKDNVISSMNESVSEIKNTTINNFEWSFVEINSENKKEYKYASVYNERLYIVNYVIREDNNKLCSNGYNTFINSLKFNLGKKDNDNTV